MPMSVQVQRVHEAYRSAMDARNGHSGTGAYRRTEAAAKSKKTELDNQVSSSFKEILSAKMSQK
jgi:hypothetical protein